MQRATLHQPPQAIKGAAWGPSLGSPLAPGALKRPAATCPNYSRISSAESPNERLSELMTSSQDHDPLTISSAHQPRPHLLRLNFPLTFWLLFWAWAPLLFGPCWWARFLYLLLPTSSAGSALSSSFSFRRVWLLLLVCLLHEVGGLLQLCYPRPWLEGLPFRCCYPILVNTSLVERDSSGRLPLLRVCLHLQSTRPFFLSLLIWGMTHGLLWLPIGPAAPFLFRLVALCHRLSQFHGLELGLRG